MQNQPELRRAALIALVFALLCLSSWEIYWRSQGMQPTLDDNKDLWAVQRAKVAEASDKDVILVGSSRVLFNIQLDQWEHQTGRRPIQLASPGSSPLPIFHDLVHNTDFRGTIVVGVTPGLFFSTTYPEAFPWKRPQTKVDHFHNRTYAQRLNHYLSVPLQKSLAMISAHEEEWSDDIDLKSLIKRISKQNRTGEIMFPPFYCFNITDDDRNTTMDQRVLSDTALAGSIQRVWSFVGKISPPPDKEATMKYFLSDLEKFKARGGKVILIQSPSSGGFKIGEDAVFPKEKFWNELVAKSGVKSYYYGDYPQLPSNCPEWSHLSAADARKFTTGLTDIMIADGTLPKLNKR